MRPYRQDFTGKTDANGNATVQLHFPTIGEWFDVKVLAIIASPALWALNINGSPVDFGLGRRPSMGPELVQDGETMALTVTSGPPATTFSGQVVGRSGTPEEMLTTWAPTSSTIALDTQRNSQARPNPFTTVVGSALQGATSFQVVDASIFAPGDTLAINFTGHGVISGFITTQPGGVNLQTNVITVAAGLTFALTGGETVFLVAPVQLLTSSGQGQQPVTLFGSSPPPWLAPNLRPIRFAGPVPGTQATALLIQAGVVGQTIYFFSLSIATDTISASTSLHLVDAPVGNPAGGTIFADISTSQPAPAPVGAGAVGAPLTQGNSLYVWQDQAAVISRGAFVISQG